MSTGKLNKRVATELDELAQSAQLGDLARVRASLQSLRAELHKREQEAADGTLQASEARLALGVQVAGLALLEVDYVADVTHLTAEAARMYGLGSEAMTVPRATVHTTFHPDDRAEMMRRIDESLDPGDVGWFEMNHRVVHPNGEVRWLRVRYQVLFDGDGAPRRPVGAMLAAFDITAEKKAAEAVRTSERLYRAIGESIAYGIWVCDADGHNTYASESFLKLAGITQQQCSEFGWSDLLHPDDVDETIAAWKQCVRTGGPWYREHRYRGADGQWHPVLACGVAVRDERGEVTAWAGINLDISRLKAVEMALSASKAVAEEARAVAEAASSAKDHFLAVLSHELRTPLAPVLSAAELLESDPSLSNDQRDHVRMIRRNVELEARLIDDLLDVTRISRNKLELQRTSVGVHEKIEHVIRICRQDLEAKGLTIDMHPGANDHHIDADPARFQQIVWNLLKNAIKFSQPFGRIWISTANRAEHRILIEVRDEGVGIAPEVLPRIFSAFEQGGKETTRLFGGLGLGLTISKALVEIHGGAIAAASEGRGKGATFTVNLPVRAAGSPTTGAKDLPESGKVGRSVLLVEDHADTSKIMARLLRGFGCEVIPAGTVSDGLALADAHRFDFLISDIGLPDGSGLELMRQIKARHGIRGIALSGYGMAEDIARSREAGFEEHLTKPVSIRNLEEALRRLIAAT